MKTVYTRVSDMYNLYIRRYDDKESEMRAGARELVEGSSTLASGIYLRSVDSFNSTWTPARIASGGLGYQGATIPTGGH